MNLDENIITKLLTLIICLVCIIIGICIGKCDRNKNDNINNIEYDKKILDSINIDINKKDSVIKELKDRMNYEIEQTINANDTATVWQFQVLVKGK